MAYNTFNEVYFNNKSLDWYEKNAILLTKDTWRPLRRDDVVLGLYGVMNFDSQNRLKLYFKMSQMSPYMKESMEIFSNFRNMHYAYEKKYTYNHYKFDKSKVTVNNNDELIVESPFDEEIINLYKAMLEKKEGVALYLIKPPVKNFLNYSELPNTK